MSKGYSENGHRTRYGQEDRELAAGILKSLNALEIEDAIGRAPRSRPDAAGRTWRIGAHVGKMVRQLIYWEGRGQADDASIHKTAREWFESEAGLTRKQLTTATRIAQEEGLLEVELDYRPSDRRPTNYYRLNMWEVARTVTASELENTVRLLEREGRKHRRDQLTKKRRKLERAQNDLNLLGERDSGNPQPEVEHNQIGQGTCPNWAGYVPKVDREPSQFGTVTGEYSGEHPVENSVDSSFQEGAPAASQATQPAAPQPINKENQKGQDTAASTHQRLRHQGGSDTVTHQASEGVGDGARPTGSNHTGWPKPAPSKLPPKLDNRRISQLDRLMQPLSGDGDNPVANFTSRHLEGRKDTNGESFTVERIARQAREQLAGQEPVAAYEAGVEYVLRFMEPPAKAQEQQQEVAV